MSVRNPYQAPKVEVELESPRAAQEGYYVVGPLKLSVLSICTFGLYELYWYYRNWQAISRSPGHRVSAFWRAFFAPIWGWSIASQINSSADEAAVKPRISAVLFGTSYFLLCASWRLPDPYWLVSTLTFVPMLFLQKTTSLLNDAQGVGDERLFRFSAWNWVGALLGGAIFILAVIGMLLPPELE